MFYFRLHHNKQITEQATHGSGHVEPQVGSYQEEQGQTGSEDNPFADSIHDCYSERLHGSHGNCDEEGSCCTYRMKDQEPTPLAHDRDP